MQKGSNIKGVDSSTKESNNEFVITRVVELQVMTVMVVCSVKKTEQYKDSCCDWFIWCTVYGVR